MGECVRVLLFAFAGAFDECAVCLRQRMPNTLVKGRVKSWAVISESTRAVLTPGSAPARSQLYRKIGPAVEPFPWSCHTRACYTEGPRGFEDGARASVLLCPCQSVSLLHCASCCLGGIVEYILSSFGVSLALLIARRPCVG